MQMVLTWTTHAAAAWHQVIQTSSSQSICNLRAQMFLLQVRPAIWNVISNGGLQRLSNLLRPRSLPAGCSTPCPCRRSRMMLARHAPAAGASTCHRAQCQHVPRAPSLPGRRMPRLLQSGLAAPIQSARTKAAAPEALQGNASRRGRQYLGLLLNRQPGSMQTIQARVPVVVVLIKNSLFRMVWHKPQGASMVESSRTIKQGPYLSIQVPSLIMYMKMPCQADRSPTLPQQSLRLLSNTEVLPPLEAIGQAACPLQPSPASQSPSLVLPPQQQPLCSRRLGVSILALASGMLSQQQAAPCGWRLGHHAQPGSPGRLLTLMHMASHRQCRAQPWTIFIR